MLDRIEVKAAFTASEKGELEGVAWPFGTADSVGDEIMPGAFKGVSDSLIMFFQHDPKQPIGEWDSLVETEKGLEVKGRLFIDTVARAREIYEFVRRGHIKGLSIGFAIKEATARRGGGRIIKSLNLSEVSIVSYPAHKGAGIVRVKTAYDVPRIVKALNRAASALST